MTASKLKHILEMQDEMRTRSKSSINVSKQESGCSTSRSGASVRQCVYGTKEEDDDASNVESDEELAEKPEALVPHLQDLYHNLASKPAALAKLEGASEVTTAASKAAEAKLDKLQEDLDRCDKYHGQYHTAECELEQLKIEREEEERPQKRSHQSRQERQPTPPEEDVEMGEVVEEPETRGRGGQSKHPRLGARHRPSQWIMSSARHARLAYWHPRVPADIQTWIAMFHETVTKRVWVPLHVLFGHWLVTKETNNAKCTTLQQYVLEHWYMPTWQHELLKAWLVTRTLSRAEQFNEVNARGCPYNDACWTLNLRLVRGLLTLRL
ncbi:hypothetical protein B0H10DRAFT_1948696 [Mycena sp. CBHHK59/15]|nr:hypothetical protein B0H10DRAFT_1948696 [Mycena sp. CBHHK59/15]